MAESDLDASHLQQLPKSSHDKGDASRRATAPDTVRLRSVEPRPDPPDNFVEAYFFFKRRSALASIFFLSAALSLP